MVRFESPIAETSGIRGGLPGRNHDGKRLFPPTGNGNPNDEMWLPKTKASSLSFPHGLVPFRK